MLVDKNGMLHAAVCEKRTKRYAVFTNHLEKSKHERKLSEEGITWIETDSVEEALSFVKLKNDD